LYFLLIFFIFIGYVSVFHTVLDEDFVYGSNMVFAIQAISKKNFFFLTTDFNSTLLFHWLFLWVSQYLHGFKWCFYDLFK